MEATAKYGFDATTNDELSFSKGAVLKVFDIEDDENWYLAELDGREGVIPSNYIEMKPHNWYQGSMARKDADAFLSGKHEGAFVVRLGERSSSNSGFTMSVKFKDTVKHFRVLRDEEEKLYLFKEDKFNSLNEMIEYHHSIALSRLHDVTLQEVKKKPKLQDQSEAYFVQALYDFTPEEDGELEFRQGDNIRVIDKSDENWWEGELDGRQGLFPVIYVST